VIVTLNGERRELENDATVAAVVALLAPAPGARGVAVAVGGEVVPRGQWGSTPLRDGARVEVVAAIQGG
jgi:sulfur carrier protein